MKTICQEEELTNDDKLCFLNISFAEYYVNGANKTNKILEQMQKYSKDLARLG